MAPGLPLPGSSGIVHAAEAGGEPSQETQDTVAADSGQAQEYALEAITVEAKRPDWESKLSPGTVTIIRPDDYKGEQKTLPELLKDVPGVHVRYVSGKGQYTTVTVRGSTAAQVGVFVDGVLSNLGGDAAVDISTIPVSNVERIEVYRGYIPARFGGTYMGGVINIVTKKPDKANISAQIGKSSWGGTTAGLEITQPLGTGSLMIGINRDQSDGDFRYKNLGVAKAYTEAKDIYDTKLKDCLDWINNDLDSYGLLGAGFSSFSSIEELKAAFASDAFNNHVINIFVTDWFMDPADAKSMWEEMKSNDYLGREEKIRKDFYGKLGIFDDTRYRRNNDYKNTDAIIKWQDDHWLVKGSWKKIDRGMPKKLFLTGDLSEPPKIGIDLPEFIERKRQKLTTKDLLVGRRNASGNTEWGWQVNYLDQDKQYRNPDSYIDAAFAQWSAFDSRRLGGAIDGTHKIGDKHMFEFLANWSKEKMDVDGSRMGKYDFYDQLPNALRFRTYYEQTLFNLQLQDTITLNQAADLWLTPSIRYNYSKVMGRAAGPYRSSIDPNHIWVKQEDSQVNDKITWQLALKKQVDDHLTLRSTYGTYYRLLNLYEIAGDGAGIMPRPNSDNNGLITGQSMFPVPEEGTQWDLSAIWDGKLLGADSSKVQLTYFGRDSKNMLQLYRFGFDFWSYTNAHKGRANGVELQGDFHWNKWDMNLAGTYMHTKQQSKNDSQTGDNVYRKMPHLYAPEWEGSVRLTYRPDNRLAIFGELKYIDEMYCWQQDPEKVQSSLTTVGLGAKYKIDKDFQIVAGVNDLFDKGPEMEFTSTGYIPGEKQNKPIEYPLQGRTYYVTLQYRY
ncbi:TonB-dependent receptor [uncultured Sporomusa sp.]|nr:TonB-dependent receptor [uncultured Sporomusa sp.]